MKDIDFDELDRAVSSLLGDAGELSETAHEPVEQPPQPDSAPVVEQPSPDNSTTTANPVTSPLIAKRSTGRFMDVVHPSSDMKTAASGVAPVSRRGVTMTPSLVATEQAEAVQAAEQKVVEPSTVPDVVDDRLPDPLDFSSAGQQEATSVTPSEQAAANDGEVSNTEQASQPDGGTSSSSTEEGSNETPFLVDTKVEKRPLGAFSVEDEEPTEHSTEVQSSAVDNDAAPTAEVETAAAPVEAADTIALGEGEVVVDDPQTQADSATLPEELQDDLLSIESDTAAKPQIDVSDVATPAGSPVAGSIAQQYQERPAAADQPAGAIYDVEAYHQPLKHPAKKKSGWLVVLLIVVFILIGVAGGAAVYYFMW